MRTTEQAVRKVISAKEVYVGIDVHKESWHVTVRSDGEEQFNGRIPGQYLLIEEGARTVPGRKDQGGLRSGPFRLLASR